MLVLLVHSTSTGVVGLSADSTLYSVYNFLNIIGAAGVPTFILLGSFVLFYNYYDRELSGKMLLSFYVKRLKYIVIPYVLFSILYFGLKWFLYYDYPSLSFAMEKFLGHLALGKAHPHLYYLFIIFQLYILFPIFLYIIQKNSFVRKHLIVIGLLLQWVWVLLNKYYFGFEMKASIAFSYLAFYFIGAYIGVNYESIRTKMKEADYRSKIVSFIYFGFGAMIVIYPSYIYLERTGMLSQMETRFPLFLVQNFQEFGWFMQGTFGALVIFYAAHQLCKVVGEKARKVFVEIGATSFGIYLIHPFFLIATRSLLPSADPIVFHAWQLATFVFIFFISWLVVRLTYRYMPMPWIWFGR